MDPKGKRPTKLEFKRPTGVETSESCEEDEVDHIPSPTKHHSKGRVSVSAEAYGVWNKKKNFVPKVVAKSSEKREKLKERLLSSFMFKNLEPKDLNIVIDAMEEFNAKQGDWVIKQGEDGDVLYVVIEGQLACSKLFEGESTPKFLLNYCPGMSFGELALLYNAPRQASIQASEDCLLYSLDRECFNNIVKDSAMRRREKYKEFLDQVSLLDTLEDSEKSKVCDCLKPIYFKKGDYIIKEGESGNVFYFVEEGTAHAEKNIGGSLKSVFNYSHGDYFGELALLKDEPRAASIIADVILMLNVE